jgi:hypothetical protein
MATHSLICLSYYKVVISEYCLSIEESTGIFDSRSKYFNMKLYTLAFALFYCGATYGQWSNVGMPGFSNSGISDPFIRINKYSTPYVAFANHATSSQGTVMKFNGNMWVYVGLPGFSVDDIDCIAMDFDSSGMPYVVYADGSDNNRATVMKFDGVNWQTVGSTGFTPGGAGFTSIAIDKNGIPYVAFRDQGDTVYNSWPNGYRVSVMKFDGANWVYVGTPGFSGTGPSSGGAIYISLALDTNGVPYVAFTNMNNNFKASVMKFDGSDWVQVGAPGISPSQVANTTMAIGDDQMPYIAYSDGASGSKATVMKFDGNNWNSVGQIGITPGPADDTFISIDANGTPFLAYKDYANGQRASVMKFDGANWVQVGSPGFSAAGGEVYDVTFTVDKNNGELFIAYDDAHYDTSGNPIHLITVMKHGNTSGVIEVKDNSLLTIYPNPSLGIFEINYSSIQKGDLHLNVFDSKGKMIYSEGVSLFQGEYKKNIDLSKQAKGAYFIEIIADRRRSIKKIILN